VPSYLSSLRTERGIGQWIQNQPLEARPIDEGGLETICGLNLSLVYQCASFWRLNVAAKAVLAVSAALLCGLTVTIVLSYCKLQFSDGHGKILSCLDHYQTLFNIKVLSEPYLYVCYKNTTSVYAVATGTAE